MTLEIRLHGRGGQGGVTCAKILAAIHAGLGKSVQTFGDYAGERSGAPVRAYTRVSDEPISNRNKVYTPDHLLVLDPTLLGDETVAGLVPGGLLLLNTTQPPAAFTARFGRFKIATIDATAIARARGIGTRSVVIVNTTIAGAYARAVGIPLEALERAYEALHLRRDLPAAREAYAAVAFGPEPAVSGADKALIGASETAGLPAMDGAYVLPLTEHVQGRPTGLKTGSWRTQLPHYIEHLAPCNAWCPAGNDVVRFIQTLQHQGEEAAAQVLAATQPLASVCGRVCPAPCMEGCSRRQYDGSVNIRALERWIGDRATVARREERPVKKVRRVAIVGSGPAGLAAAYELARAGHEATIYEGEKSLGGVLRTGIPSYRLPREVLDREIDGILDLGVEARTGVFLDREKIAELGGRYDAVILAFGLARLTGLEAAGKERQGVEQGIRFLHRLNFGDGAPLRGHVVVLGGGNTAMDCARSALRLGAERVTVAYRRTHEEMPAIREEIEEAANEGVEFLFLRQPVAFRGNGRVEEVELAEVELGDPDETGRRRPLVTDRTSRLRCDTVLLAIGQSADRGVLPEGAEVVNGRVHRNGRPMNLFVAGDFATGEGTVAHAIGDGRRAAGRALRALGEDAKVFVRPDRAEAVPISGIHFDHFPPAPPALEPHLPVAERRRSFAESNRGLSNAKEAERCFSCGHCTQCDTCLVYCPEGIIDRTSTGYAVDLNFCKGCGICVTECPRDALEMLPA
jgi:2-oxoacid:acceptor oxidoreductase gamma subunit (pyruvate/2-ketoisovalerate family)/2-oxoacid:acceptor oxidoreductase delta subunit (pyruvate/2-ketoisovalerate family)